eukprot:CAMPEP_0114163060 /NCGR_PEP_ID=MMETSP0043_2-20121206/29878_1 /TAXON_ID=464988 /ORGANISM="Hemiselmis andersenii, Strain CCMP644" /LENGTH=63 /DNA_ID=CAMNT_0001259519 /DNA_START=47 /DNA_END=234 /DNA_ORIENTATION=+
MGRAVLQVLPLLLLLSPSFSSLSEEEHYRLIFSDGINFPSADHQLKYTSARKYQSTGDAASAV